MKASEVNLLCGLAGLLAVERPSRLTDENLQARIRQKIKLLKEDVLLIK